MRFALFVLVAVLVVIAFQVAYYAPRLPDTVASHFGAGGQPDGWSSKTELFVVYGVVILVTVTPFLLLPWLLPKIPDDLINMPKKDYWLAPERREETFRIITVYLLWMGIGTLMMLAHVMGLAMAANLEPEPRLAGSFWWSFGLYMAFVVAWTVTFVRRFYRTE
ncbi:MAG: DUF1648 domain-containing protein [Acidobacteriota bacterium]|jgi:uncharacterized membrane protein